MPQPILMAILVSTPPTPGPSLVQILLPLVIILPLVVFWLWMFRDLLNNNDLPGAAKNTWIVAFIVLNAFAAVFYYVYEYRPRH